MITFPEYKINNQTILQEQFDENYEPTPEEIREYAVYIGIEPDKETNLLWLAKEGIMKPLPPGWKPCQEENGELYYFNFDTGKSSWDHPCDEIYKARVAEERKKQQSSITNLRNSSLRDTFNQTGRSTSTVSDYLSGDRKPLTMGTNMNTSVVTRTQAHTTRIDSQYVNSDNDEIEEELMNSDNDDDEQSSDGFKKGVDFGIDPLLSARIERKEKETITTSAISASRTSNSKENTLEKQADNRRTSPDNDDDDNSRKHRADLAASAALRRFSNGNMNKSGGTLIHEDATTTPREDFDTSRLRARLEQAANEEKLQIIEENERHLEKLRKELRSAKEKDEQALRNKMKAEISSIENEVRESITREKKLLDIRKQEELNNIKQSIEREKEDLQRKLREGMQSDLNTYKTTLDQHSNANAQIRSLQEKANRDKHEFEEKLRQIENRHQNEIDDWTRRYEQVKSDRDKLEKYLKEKDNHCTTLQRTIDQLRDDKSAAERKLHDAEIKLKAIENDNRQRQLALARKSVRNASDNDEDEDDDENLNPEKTISHNKNDFNDDDDAAQLSDSDSDVVQMEQTMKELRQTQREYMSILPIANVDEKQNVLVKTGTVDLTKLSVADVSPVVRNIRAINRNSSRMYESLETIPNQFLTDSGRWSNTMTSTLGSNINSPLMYQTLNGYQPLASKTNHWGSQPSLVTREAVLKAARKVFSPSVVDQLTLNTKASSY